GVGLAYRVIPRQRVDLVVAELNGVEDTSRMLSRITSEVYRVGENLLNRVVETEDVHVFFESARKFTSMLFDYAPAKSLLSGLKGVIDYYMKKSALVVWVEREYADDVLSSIKSKGIRAFKTTISPIGVNLVHTN
ncbi:MAG: kinase, partial [Desulfurococcaceae archaeon]